MNHIVIIGAGQAAAQAVVSLRQGGYEDAITLIGDEQELPYQRPPLSKKYLSGEMEAERQTGRQTDRQTERQTDRQTETQTDKQTDTQTDTKTDRHEQRYQDTQTKRQLD